MPLPEWFPAWIVVSTKVVAGGLFLLGRFRGGLAVVVGIAMFVPVISDTALPRTLLGAGNVFLWLLFVWETREAWAVWSNKPLSLASINIGSANLLRGKVQVLHLFLDTSRRQWKHKNRKSTMRKIERASRWMVAQAKCYGVPLVFEHTIIKATDLCFTGEIPALNNNYANSIGFEQFLADVLEKNRSSQSVSADEIVADENICLVVHAAQYIGHMAYAMPTYRGREPGPQAVEYAVVGAWRSAGIYAHELLHLFGAADYYDTRRSEFGKRLDELRAPLLGRSIMFAGYRPLNQLTIDEQTAQSVGWL